MNFLTIQDICTYPIGTRFYRHSSPYEGRAYELVTIHPSYTKCSVKFVDNKGSIVHSHWDVRYVQSKKLLTSFDPYAVVANNPPAPKVPRQQAMNQSLGAGYGQAASRSPAFVEWADLAVGMLIVDPYGIPFEVIAVSPQVDKFVAKTHSGRFIDIAKQSFMQNGAWHLAARRNGNARNPGVKQKVAFKDLVLGMELSTNLSGNQYVVTELVKNSVGGWTAWFETVAPLQGNINQEIQLDESGFNQYDWFLEKPSFMGQSKPLDRAFAQMDAQAAMTIKKQCNHPQWKATQLVFSTVFNCAVCGIAKEDT